MIATKSILTFSYSNHYKTCWSMKYCLKCKKKGKKYRKCSSKVWKTKNCRTMLLTKCVVCNSKKSILMKEQKAKEIWSILRRRTPLNKMPLVKYCFSNCHKYKMNKIVNKFLLARDKFLTEMHLKQPWFTYEKIYLQVHLLKTKKELKSLCI